MILETLFKNLFQIGLNMDKTNMVQILTRKMQNTAKTYWKTFSSGRRAESKAIANVHRTSGIRNVDKTMIILDEK